MFAAFEFDAIEERARQQRDILHALAQRWQVDGNHVDAIEKILAEGALFNQGRQVAVCG